MGGFAEGDVSDEFALFGVSVVVDFCGDVEAGCAFFDFGVDVLLEEVVGFLAGEFAFAYLLVDGWVGGCHVFLSLWGFVFIVVVGGVGFKPLIPPSPPSSPFFCYIKALEFLPPGLQA